jgi:Threonine dehydratase
MINSFEDEGIIAGSGTLAKEVVDELGNVNTILVPVGSGNLLAGTIVALKDRNIKVVGVEPEGAASMLASMKNGRPTTISRLDTIADGLVAKHPGIKSFNIIKEVLKRKILLP